MAPKLLGFYCPENREDRWKRPNQLRGAEGLQRWCKPSYNHSAHASKARCCLPASAQISPQLLQRLEPGRRPQSGPFLRALRMAHPKDNLSWKAYLPTSSAHPMGSPAAASLTGGNLGRDPLSCSCSNSSWPLSGDTGRPQHQLQMPAGSPPWTTAAPWHAWYCTTHLPMLCYLTENIWMHFHVVTLQQHRVWEPSSPPRKYKRRKIWFAEVMYRNTSTIFQLNK